MASRRPPLGAIPIFVSAGDLWRAEDLAAAPVAVLVLREVPSADKVTVCASLRASPRYGSLPLVVATTLAEGALSLPAGALMRPPAPLAQALAEIKRLVPAAALAQRPVPITGPATPPAFSIAMGPYLLRVASLMPTP